MQALSFEEQARIEGACQRLIYLAAARVDAGDYAAFCGLFTADGLLVRPDGSSLRGPDAILAAYRARPAHRMTRHVVSNTFFFDVSAQSCRATSLVTLWGCDSRTVCGPSGYPVEQPLILGEFDDSFHREEAGWRIATRRARFLMHTPGKP